MAEVKKIENPSRVTSSKVAVEEGNTKASKPLKVLVKNQSLQIQITNRKKYQEEFIMTDKGKTKEVASDGKDKVEYIVEGIKENLDK